MKKYLIIFDIDGTLVDCRQAWVSAANALLARREQKAQFTRDWVAEHCQLGAGKLIAELNHRLGKDCLDEFWDSLFFSFFGEIQVHFDHRSMEPLLDAATLCALTNKSRADLSNTLKLIGHDWMLSDVVTSDDFERKPSPKGINFLRQRYKIRQENVLMVGDSRRDHDAASAAGVAYVHCAYGYDNGFVPQKKAATVDTPMDLIPTLEAQIGDL